MIYDLFNKLINSCIFYDQPLVKKFNISDDIIYLADSKNKINLPMELFLNSQSSKVDDDDDDDDDFISPPTIKSELSPNDLIILNRIFYDIELSE
jgi:hypothetical protein